MPKAHVLKERLKITRRASDDRQRAIKILSDKQSRRPLTEGESGRLKILLRAQEIAQKTEGQIERAAERKEAEEREAA